MARPRLGLRTRVFLVLLLAVAPFAALSFWDAWEERSQARDAARRETSAVVQDLLREHSNRIDGARLLLTALAASPDIASPGPGCDRLVRDLQSAAPRYANIGAVSLDGTLYCSALPWNGTVSVADRAYFRRALEEDGFAVGDYQVGRVTGRPGLNMGMPLHRDGRQVGVAFVALDLHWLSEQLSLDRVGEGGTVVVFDQNGLILARQPRPDDFVGKVMMGNQTVVDAILAAREGTVEAHGLDGVLRYYSFAPVPGAPEAGQVFVAAGMPLEVLDAPAEAAFARAGVLLATTLVLAVLAAGLVAEASFLRPLKSVSHAVHRMRSGDLSARTGVPATGEVGRLAQGVDEMAAAVQQLDRTRTNLIHTAAHELSTPLSTLRVGAAALLARGDLSAEGRRAVETLARNIERLQRVAAAILVVARLQAGTLKPVLEKVDVAAAVRDRAAVLQDASDAREIHISAQVPPGTVLADRNWLARVLDQVLDNAVRYTPPGGQVRVEGEAAGRRLVLRVQDSGIGIPPERMEGLFQPFNPIHSEPGAGGGLGLGLYTARELVERMGGRIEVASPGPGRGTTVVLHLPLDG